MVSSSHYYPQIIGENVYLTMEKKWFKDPNYIFDIKSNSFSWYVLPFGLMNMELVKAICNLFYSANAKEMFSFTFLQGPTVIYP